MPPPSRVAGNGRERTTMVLSSYVGATVRRKEDPRLITGSSTYVDDISPAGHGPRRVRAQPLCPRQDRRHRRLGRAGDAGRASRSSPPTISTQVLQETSIPVVAGQRDRRARIARRPPRTTRIPVPAVEPLARRQGPLRRRAGRRRGRRDRGAIAEDAARARRRRLRTARSRHRSRTRRGEPGAPQLYDEVKNNISVREQTVHGDVDAAFAAAPVKVKARIRAPRCRADADGGARRSLAAPDPITRGLTFWTSTQAPHWNRNEIAEALGLSPDPGAAASRRRSAAASAARSAPIRRTSSSPACAPCCSSRPVKWIETRSENFLATNHGRNQWADFEVGADAERQDHRRCAARVVLDSGAYPKALDLAWCDLGDVDRPVRHPESRLRRRRRLHQHDGERRLSRRGPAGSGLLPRAGDGSDRRRGAGSTRPRCAGSTSSRRTSSPTPRSPASTTTPASTKSRSTKALEAGRLRRAAQGAGEAAQAGPLPRHRPRVLCRDLRLRPVRELDRARRAERRRHDLHRHLAARPGPGDDLRPDRRRLHRRRFRQRRRPPRRHRQHAAGQRHDGQPRTGGRRRGAGRCRSNKIKDKAMRIAAHMLEAAVEDIELVERQVPGQGRARPRA